MREIRPLLNRRMDVLSERDVEAIHAASLQVLEETGVDFHAEDALRTLGEGGCRINGSRALIPAKLVAQALKKVPSAIVLRARDPQKNLHLGSGAIHTMSAFGASFVREAGSNVVRHARLKDLEEFTKVFDHLELIDCCLKAVIPQDVPARYADLHAMHAMFANTDKNIHVSQDCPTDIPFVTRKMIELGSVAAAEYGADAKPFFSLGCCPDSPLQYSGGALVRMRIAVEAGIPFLIVSGAIAGVSTPVTLAGLLVVQHAELLAGLVYAQLVRPGSEIAFGSFASASDMKTGKMRLGCIEQSLIGVATQQLCSYCGVCYGYGTGSLTDSELLDAQSGFDKGISLCFQMLGGVDVIHDAAGLLGSAMVMNLEQIVMDHEYIRMIAHGLRGIEVSPDTLAVDLIREKGPGGNFLTEEHTFAHFKQELFLSDILPQASPLEGPVDETRGMRELALKKARGILETHHPAPLPRDADKRMRTILAELPS